MKAILQRVSNASVEVDGNIAGQIGNGFLILLGVEAEDEKSDAEILQKKFPDCVFLLMKTTK